MQIVWMIQEEWTIINLSLFFPRLVIIRVWRFATEFIRRVSSTNGRSSKPLEFLWSPELFENFKFETSIHTGIYKERYTLCKFMRSIGGTLIRGNFISIHDGGSLMESCNWKLFFNGSKCIPLLIGRRAKRKLIPFFFFFRFPSSKFYRDNLLDRWADRNEIQLNWFHLDWDLSKTNTAFRLAI